MYDLVSLKGRTAESERGKGFVGILDDAWRNDDSCFSFGGVDLKTRAG